MADNSEPDARVYFAAERTFLAWLRTGIALVGLGFVVARFAVFLREIAATTGRPATTQGASQWFGIAFVVLGLIVIAVSFGEHVATVRRLNRGDGFSRRPTRLGALLVVVLIVVASVMTVFLFVP